MLMVFYLIGLPNKQFKISTVYTLENKSLINLLILQYKSVELPFRLTTFLDLHLLSEFKAVNYKYFYFL